jgi:hypothetical protein
VQAPLLPWELLPWSPTTFPSFICPQVHTNPSRNFLGFVGNASNRIGEFSCIHIHKDSFGFFQIINSKANLDKAIPGHSSNLTPFALDLLTNTDWANPLDDIMGALFTNFFIVYFGQDFPQGGISSNNIKVKFAKLSKGYNLWVSAAAEAIDKKDDIREVLGAASEQTNYSRTNFLKSHFFPFLRLRQIIAYCILTTRLHHFR